MFSEIGLFRRIEKTNNPENMPENAILKSKG